MGSKRSSVPAAASLLSVLTFVALAGLGSPAIARAGSSQVSRHARVTANVHHDTSPPLRDLKPSSARSRSWPARRVEAGPPRPIVHAKDTSGTRPGRPRIPSPSANFDGISANGSAPPDTQGAAGPTQY